MSDLSPEQQSWAPRSAFRTHDEQVRIVHNNPQWDRARDAINPEPVLVRWVMRSWADRGRPPAGGAVGGPSCHDHYVRRHAPDVVADVLIDIRWRSQLLPGDKKENPRGAVVAPQYREFGRPRDWN